MGSFAHFLATMVKKVSKGAAPKVEFPKNAIEKKPRKFAIGGDVLPKRDLTRFVRWPKYVRLQRAKMTLLKRIKVPPAINQFSLSFDKRQASQLFRLLNNLKPETKAAKKERLAAQAEKIAAGDKSAAGKKPVCVKMGVNHVTTLVEEKKAQLVVIAHDVDPIELVVWLPALCRKMDIPYCIVKSKSRLGALVHKKTATAIALTSVKQEDRHEFSQLVTAIRQQYNENAKSIERTWGGGIMGVKSQAKTAKIERAIAKEAAKKAMM